MEYQIKGITCSSCKKLIEMDLGDAGFENCVVSEERKSIEIPDSYSDRLQEISKVVSGAGAYELIDKEL